MVRALSLVDAFVALDRILRGEATHPDALELERFRIPLRGVLAVLLLLGGLHGTCVGVYALVNHDAPGVRQLVASAVKVPALFLLTLLVTTPSLYVFNALVGSRLRFLPLVRLLVASLGVSIAVLASFGPVVAFFSCSTTSYPFMVLLNVVTFGGAGLLGLKFLHQTLQRMSESPARDDDRVSPAELPTAPLESEDASVGVEVAAGEAAVEIAAGEAMAEATGEPAGEIAEGTGATREADDAVEADEDLGALERLPGQPLLGGARVRTVFVAWMICFGLVGAQMSWVLRPFIGEPNSPFTWLRPRQSNFFEAVWGVLRSLIC